MTRDSIARFLAVTAIVIACFVGLTDDECNCAGGKPRNLLWRLLRLGVWTVVTDEPPQPVQDPGALRYENTPPDRTKGPTGEVELEHGRGF